MLLYPESLENSKLLSILSDTNLNFKIIDMLNIKEISKLYSNKEELFKDLKSIEYIKVSDDNETGSININENIVVFSLINLPQKLSKEEVLKNLGIDTELIIRLYKKCLFWILVTEKPQSELIEKKLSCVTFGDSKLKYDMITKAQMMKSINKQIQTVSYHKEAHDLKVELSNKKNEKSNYNSNNYNSNNKDRTNSEAFSWRKKSGEGNMCSPDE
jgi:hypothetical protein